MRQVYQAAVQVRCMESAGSDQESTEGQLETKAMSQDFCCQQIVWRLVVGPSIACILEP